MTLRVEWAPVAVDDFADILDYITTEASLAIAERVASKILARVKTLTAHPRRGRVIPELRIAGVHEYRELISSPYRVLYRIHSRSVAVVGVLDGRRDLEETLFRRYLGNIGEEA